MKIITQQIYQSQGKQTRQDLNSILKEWSWQNKPFTSSQDFIQKMKPWIDERIKQQAEVKEFLKRWKVKNLAQIKEVKT